MTHGVNHFSGGAERNSGYTPAEEQKFPHIVIRNATKEDIGFDSEHASQQAKNIRTLESASLHGGGT